MENRILVALDIGTTKIGVVIGQVNDEDEVEIVGIGTSVSDGLKKGVVVHIDKTVQSIKKAIEEAENVAGIEVREVVVGIAGRHIQSFDSKGIITVAKSDSLITPHDIQRCIEQASTFSIPEDREIIHVIPQNFVVDDQSGIKDPVGMCGIKIEGNVHIVTAAISSAQNIYNSVRKAGIDTSDIVLEPLASAYAVLDSDERELGCAVIDMGSGTTDIAVYANKSIKYTSSIEFGGANVTSDLAIALRTPIRGAESIKVKYGACAVSNIEEEQIKVPGVGGAKAREIEKSFVAKVIRARMKEIFEMVYQDLKKHKLTNNLGAGIIITGGGSLCEGTARLAEEVFEGIPVKVGYPKKLKGLYNSVHTPIHATGVGLLLYGLEQLKANGTTKHGNSSNDGVINLFRKFAGWAKNYI